MAAIKTYTTVKNNSAIGVIAAEFGGASVTAGGHVHIDGTLGSYIAARHGGASRSRRMLMRVMNGIADAAGHVDWEITEIPTNASA